MPERYVMTTRSRSVAFDGNDLLDETVGSGGGPFEGDESEVESNLAERERLWKTLTPAVAD